MASRAPPFYHGLILTPAWISNQWPVKYGMKLPIHPQLVRLNLWRFEMDEYLKVKKMILNIIVNNIVELKAETTFRSKHVYFLSIAENYDNIKSSQYPVFVHTLGLNDAFMRKWVSILPQPMWFIVNWTRSSKPRQILRRNTKIVFTKLHLKMSFAENRPFCAMPRCGKSKSKPGCHLPEWWEHFTLRCCWVHTITVLVCWQRPLVNTSLYNACTRSWWRHHWSFVRGIHWSPVNSPHKGQWRRVWCFLWSAPE